MIISHTSWAETETMLYYAEKHRPEYLYTYESRLLKTNFLRVIFSGLPYARNDEEKKREEKLIQMTTLPFVSKLRNRKYLEIVSKLWDSHDCVACGNQVVYRRAVANGCLEPKFMFIGEAPGVANGPKECERAWGIGNSSMILRNALRKLDIAQYSCYSNIMKCAFPSNVSDFCLYEKCTHFLLDEIKLLNPKLIFIMGNKVHHFIWDKLREYNVVKIMHPSYYLYKGLSPDDFANSIENSIGEYL